MDKCILLGHGSGGKLSHDLITQKLIPYLANNLLNKMDDSAVFEINGRTAFTTDSFVINPIFFPGGDIGKLAICGTINDLAMVGAEPLYMSLAMIIEEGLPLADFEEVLNSIRSTIENTGVKIITGDTKVVNRGSVDKLFINTTGLGLLSPNVDISGSNAMPGDKIILSGSIGDHGIAVMSKREGLRFKIPVQSDCAPLNSLVKAMLTLPESIHCMRDPTRGGLATALNEMASQSRATFTIHEDRIIIKESVRLACDMLGIDPFYVANEGKLIAIVAEQHAEKILDAMRQNPQGRDSTIIGEVVEGRAGRVIMKNTLGSSRILDMLSGELLPRIC